MQTQIDTELPIFSLLYSLLHRWFYQHYRFIEKCYTFTFTGNTYIYCHRIQYPKASKSETKTRIALCCTFSPNCLWCVTEFLICYGLFVLYCIIYNVNLTLLINYMNECSPLTTYKLCADYRQKGTSSDPPMRAMHLS